MQCWSRILLGIEVTILFPKKRSIFPNILHSFALPPTKLSLPFLPIILHAPTSAIHAITAASWDQGVRQSCEHWCYLDLFLLFWSMDRVNSPHNHWFLISQAQEIGILVIKMTLSTRLSPMPSSHHYYFHTPIIP